MTNVINLNEIVDLILERVPTLSRADIEDVVSSMIGKPIDTPSLDPLVTSGLVQESDDANGGGSSDQDDSEVSDVRFPESFRCIYDPVDEKYSVCNPIVSTPAGNITAESDSIDVGTWYCKVSLSNGTYSAEIVSSDHADDDTIVVVPLFEITNDDGIHQFHVGTIVIGVKGREYISGDDTNVRFTEVTSGSNKGKIKIDVYYK